MRLMLVLASVVTLFVALVLVFFRATRKTYPGFGLWTTGVALLGLGYLLLAMRGFIPDSVSIFVGNAAFPLGMVLHLDALKRFLGLGPASRWWYALPIPVLAGLGIFYFGLDRANWRGVCTAVALTAVHWNMAGLIFSRPNGPHDFFRTAIGALLAGAGALLLARAAWIVCVPQYHLLWNAPLEFAFFMSVIVIHLGESLSLMMLTSQRVEMELLESQADLRLTVDRLEASLAEREQAEEALRQSEEKYRTFFLTSRDTVFMTSLDGRLIDFNDAALDMLGYSEEDRAELFSHKVADLYARPEDREAHAALVAAKGFSKEYPVDLRRRDGSVIHTLMTTVATRNQDGRVIGFQGTIRDITERKRMEELTLQAARLKSVADLSAGVAHHFNNLLQIIMGNTVLCLSDLEVGDTAEMKKSLNAMLAASKLGAETVRRLQSFAHTQGHLAECEGAQFDLGAVAKNAVDLTQPFWKTGPEKRGIEVKLAVRVEEGCFAQGNENEIFEVLVNLIQNAAEALVENGEITVRVNREGNEVVARVSDTGVGIGPADMERVFQPFWSTKGVAIGTGMGLAVAHGVVKRHRGAISVKSVPGEGTEFTVRLPLSAPGNGATPFMAAVP